MPKTGTERSRDTARQLLAEGPGFDERQLILAVLAGDEAAFVALVSRHHSMLARLARLYVPDQESDGLLQDVWLGLLSQLDHLDARVSLRVTLFKLVIDQARHRLPATSAAIPFAAHWDPSAEPAAPSVDPSNFRTSAPWIGHWAISVAEWGQVPVGDLTAPRTRDRVEQALATLSPAQREVITLRDVEGWTSDEVSTALGIADATQRTLLHRARSRIRASLEVALLEN